MERKLLQIAFAIAGLVLVGFGLAGVFFGANFADLSGNVVMDSYFRFLKGMLLASAWSTGRRSRISNGTASGLRW